MGNEAQKPMTEAERKEHARLRELWVMRKLTKGQMLRCMELDRRAEQEALIARVGGRA